MLTTSRTILVEWGDCDPAGIVFFPRYLIWFDACTHALFRSAHCGMDRLQENYAMHGLPTVDVRAKFYIPSRPAEEVRVDSMIAEFRRSSFDVHHRMFKGDALAGEGWETRVWVVSGPDGRLKSAPIPPDVKARFEV